jgi:hypothetical protein
MGRFRVSGTSFPLAVAGHPPPSYEQQRLLAPDIFVWQFFPGLLSAPLKPQREDLDLPFINQSNRDLETINLDNMLETGMLRYWEARLPRQVKTGFLKIHKTFYNWALEVVCETYPKQLFVWLDTQHGNASVVEIV